MAADVLQQQEGHDLSIHKTHGKRKVKKTTQENVSDAVIHRPTKERLDKLLKNVLDEAKNEEVSKRNKKKKKPTAGQDSLEALKADFNKDGQDASLLANTYEPYAESPDSKSNLKRADISQGKQNVAFENETEVRPVPARRRKSGAKTPSNASRESIAERQSVTALSRLSLETPASIVHEENEAEKKPLQKKKSKSLLSQSSQEEAVNVNELQASVEKQPSEHRKKRRRKDKLTEKANEIEMKEIKSETKIAVEADSEEFKVSTEKRKKKGKHVRLATDVEETILHDDAKEPELAKFADDGRVLGITIHKTDRLQTDLHVLHPLVKVHVVDAATGQYVQKLNKDRSVTTYYETANKVVNFVLPVATQPFDFKKRRSMNPVWEESLIFNENFNYFVDSSSNVLLLFELLDFGSMTAAKQQYNNMKRESGWHRIAWAFLKIVGANKKLNTGKKARLQLYLPPTRYKSKPDTIDVYEWWLCNTRRKYPSTLYVTVAGIVLPSNMEPSSRSMFAVQEERARFSFEDLVKASESKLKFFIEEPKSMPSTWSRLKGQPCKVPNKAFLSLSSGNNRCFTISFSNDGKYLACGCQDKDTYPLMIYQIPSGEFVAKLNGHFGIVYDLSWSKDDKLLLSASSDGTTRLWNCADMRDTAVRRLPHPGFVYAAQFHPRVSLVLVTGGYDHVVRVWSFSDLESGSEGLLQEQFLQGHKSLINCLRFDEDGDKLYSADSKGIICIWNVYVTDKKSKKGLLREWTLYKQINDPELLGTPINDMHIHPSGHKLVLQCKDNTLQMLDLRILSVTQKYVGALNFRERVRSTLSPCGTFLISGSEDGMGYVWNVASGDQVAVYSELNYKHTVTDVAYHPHDHIIAFCSFKENYPVLVYKYDPKVAQVGMMFQRVTDLQNVPVDLKEETPTSISVATGARRLDRVMRKLNSVTAFTEGARRKTEPIIAAGEKSVAVTSPKQRDRYYSMYDSTALSWGSTFDQSHYLETIYQAPSSFSPHARNPLDEQQQQHLSSQLHHLRSPRPHFSEVGRSSPVHHPQSGRQTTTAQIHTDALSYAQVVALYDYKAQRSDELSFTAGDLITILYKDNENWWMGEMTDGQQGFFPSNYIAEQVSEIGVETPAAAEVSDIPIKKTRAVIVDKELQFVSEPDIKDASNSAPIAKKEVVKSC